MAEKIKEILEQYCDVQQEIKDIKTKIDKLQSQIAKLEEKGYTVKDSVTGGEGGERHYQIEGTPYPEYSKKKSLLIVRCEQLADRELRLLELTNRAERYIGEIQSSQIRRIITYRFLDNLTWIQIAHRMGKNYTADSCRMKVDRFLEIN